MSPKPDLDALEREMVRSARRRWYEQTGRALVGGLGVGITLAIVMSRLPLVGATLLLFALLVSALAFVVHSLRQLRADERELRRLTDDFNRAYAAWLASRQADEPPGGADPS